MMMRLMVTALCAGFIGSAVAADEVAQEEAPPSQQEAPAPAVAEPVPGVAPPPAPASGVPPTAAPAPTTAAPEAEQSASKSSIPLEKRRGGDITRCLSDGVKTDKEIAACAEPYSPRHKQPK